MNSEKPLIKIFERIAPAYERTNHMLTFFMDKHWRSRAAALLFTSGDHPRVHADLCSGTGETARIIKARFRETRVISVDISEHMLKTEKTGKEKDGIMLCRADTFSLPFRTDSLDEVSITFALRNLETLGGLEKAFREISRILKPGGRLMTAETSQPSSYIVRSIFHFYAKKAVPFFGGILSGSREGFKYLGGTMKNFHDEKSLSQIMQRSGLQVIKTRKYFFGAIAVHICGKPCQD
ncbi:MAG: ubiquinone/menaquinone biosynthesis methyltransferase [Fibrobacterota bacterium]